MRHNMNISLTPALEKFVQDEAASGLYSSVSGVIREALRLPAAKDNVSAGTIVQLNKDIEEGFNDTVILDGNSAMKKLIEKYE